MEDAPREVPAFGPKPPGAEFVPVFPRPGPHRDLLVDLWGGPPRLALPPGSDTLTVEEAPGPPDPITELMAEIGGSEPPRPPEEEAPAAAPRRHRRRRRRLSLLLVGTVCAAGALVVWTQFGVVMAVAAGVGLAVLALGLRLVVGFAMWRPMRARSRIGSRLPLVVVLAAVAVVIFVPGRVMWGLVRAALDARTASLTLPPLSEGSTVLDANGQSVAVFHADVNRDPVPLSAVAPVMVKAVIDTEDARFRSHGGVDLYSLVRASLVDTFGNSGRQGGSTLAMQLVKNTLLTNRHDDARTKVQEAVLADRLERKIGRNGVLEDYLNTVYFGEGSYGVQAAAEEFFAIPASQLNAAQAALLAGLIQNPGGYDPLYHPKAGTARRQTVLDLMVAHHDLTRTQAGAATAVPVPRQGHPPPSGQDYFLEAVKQELLANPALGSTPDARYHALFFGGLTIHTTLDPTLQQEAISAVTNGIPNNSLHLSAALVSIDPATGAVRAVVGGPSFASSQFDTALASPGRPTGSSFKVFTLVAALEQGWQPTDMVDGSGPCTIPDPGGTPDPWILDNYEGEAFGAIPLTTAMANSVNCAFARLSLQVGLPNIAQVAHQMGVTVPLAVVPSMTLGTNSVPPLQMASAYATLADDGVFHRPHLVTSVANSQGHTILAESAPGVPVLDPTIARTATHVLEQVVNWGTGTAAGLSGHDVAGKTGTGQNYADAWFVGYTPDLATAVWMGSPIGEVPMRDVGGISVAGGTYPARMWHAFMDAAETGLPYTAFPNPTGLLPERTQPDPWSGTPADANPTTTTSSTTSTTAPGSTTTTKPTGSSTSTTTHGGATTSTTTPGTTEPPTTAATTTTVPSPGAAPPNQSAGSGSAGTGSSGAAGSTP